MTENDIDLSVARCIEAAQLADRNLWVAALHASRVVGVVGTDGARAIASQIARSPDAVERWAHAFWMLEEFWRIRCKSVRKLRKSLTVTHFAIAYDYFSRYPVEAKEIYRHLWQVLDYKQNGEPHSVKILRQELEAHVNKNHIAQRPRFVLRDIRKKYIEWVSDDALSEAVHDWLLAAPEEVKNNEM